MLKAFAAREHDKMKEVLMSPEAEGPEIDYYMIRGGSDKKNVTTWETGTVGGEYIKTYGHYHVGHLDETYWFLEGEGVAVLQKRKEDESGNPIDDELEAIYAIKVKAGDALFIPSGMGHLVVNTGKVWLVTADDSPVNFEEKDPVSLPGHADYEAVKKQQGFGYYIVEENGEPKAVPNSKYKNLPEISWMSVEEWKSQVGR
jgi:oxalate decarboxylase/phosphoglucose isomerase-like protein (cupin superfamily)